MAIAGKFLSIKGDHHYHWCPACNEPHGVTVNSANRVGASWTFDGNLEAPTYSPSILCFTTFGEDGERLPNGQRRTLCHYFIRAGQIEYCGDSPHTLAGKTVPMVPYPESWG